MATHGFTGEMTFRVSDTTLLGDVTDKDTVAKTFRSHKPAHAQAGHPAGVRGLKFPKPLSVEKVPTIIGEKPVPVKAPPPATVKVAIPPPSGTAPKTPPKYKTIHLAPTILPDKLLPLMQEIPEMVGTPVLFEKGLAPFPPLKPIEMVLNAVITEHTVAEFTTTKANDLVVSVREYHIRFSDPAQALWKQHFPLELHTHISVKAVNREERQSDHHGPFAEPGAGPTQGHDFPRAVRRESGLASGPVSTTG